MISCGKFTPVVYSEFVNIGEEGISQNWEYTFSPVPFDSTEINNGRYDVILVVRYTANCVSKNIILDVESFSSESTQPDSARLNLSLFSDDDTPIGRGNLRVFEISDTLFRSISIPFRDGYVISISSPLPKEETKGIIDIGVKLSRTGESEFNLLKLLMLKD